MTPQSTFPAGMSRKTLRGAAATVFTAAAASLAGPACAQPAPGAVPEGVTVRDGFELTVAAAFEDAPRFMAVGPDGTLYVSQPREGCILALWDTDGDGDYDQRRTFVSGYVTVHGMAWHDGELWFTQTGAIHKAADADGVQTVIPEGEIPAGGGHWWRSILIHDGRLYTSIGDSGNIRDETDTERQKIWRFNLDGTGKALFASGIRNTEKLVVRPGTDEVWGMDHGSDWFGREVGDRPGKQPITDVNPPDEMNHYVEGGFYGHPFIAGHGVPRYEYLDRSDIIDFAERTTLPRWKSGAHWAPNAMAFYDGQQFPEAMRGDAFVAYHGSWNRDRKAGYQVTRVLFDRGEPYGELSMVEFLTSEQRVLGRPVDVVVDRDGTLLISDDHGNKVYRLRYTGDAGP